MSDLHRVLQDKLLISLSPIFSSCLFLKIKEVLSVFLILCN